MRIPKFASAAVASTALLFATTGTPALACQPGQGGCVLPLPAAPPVPVVMTSPGNPAVPMVDVGGSSAFDILPWILGVAALAALAYFVLLNEDEVTSP
jgi:hypothetical protein